MAEAISTLLTDDALRMRLGGNAAEDARSRFDLERHMVPGNLGGLTIREKPEGEEPLCAVQP